jgi:hypothetical protein
MLRVQMCVFLRTRNTSEKMMLWCQRLSVTPAHESGSSLLGG